MLILLEDVNTQISKICEARPEPQMGAGAKTHVS